jgi:penicillin-binding protein 1B
MEGQPVARRPSGIRKSALAKWWRRGPLSRRIRIASAAGFLALTFALGFYLAGLYENISTLIEERHAALTSAIYSAPTTIQVGDDIDHLNLIERLRRLSYTQTQSPTSPGEFAMFPGAMWINVREFRVGVNDRPAGLIRIVLHGKKISGIGDAYGIPQKRAALEPEVIGRLLPGAPAERVEVRLDELPPYLVKGLLDTEDRWFYYHPGFDPIRIVEAALNDLRRHHLSQGASTITQQLARTFMDRHERSFSRKFRELAVALVIEFRLSKNAILERYINDVPMGENDGTPVEGMPLAARYFFNKDLREVTPVEAATLIGMIQAPTAYDPRRHPEQCRKRRDTVLVIMRVNDLIDQPTYTAATTSPVQVAKMPGLRRAPYFADYVTSFVKRIPGLDGHLDGLKVYTTLDTEYQADAQEALESNLARLEKSRPRLRRKDEKDRLESAMVALDATSGAIVAMVGGRDYAASQFNRVTQAERQPGSAFKPIVSLAAMDPDRSPLHPPLTLASVLPDEPISFNGWIPANYERTYQPQVTVLQALSESLNVPTAYVGNQLGPPLMVKTAHEMGIRSDLPAVLPMAIGADEVTLLELTSAYQTFASMGEQATPYAVESVSDANGKLIYQHTPQTSQVIDPNVAYLMTGGLKAVLRSGTGASSARLGIDFPAAGKTGTTQDYKDGYFIGYTPEVVCGVWVGFDQPAPTGMTGAQSALPAWVDFMVSTAPDDAQDFPIPSGVEFATIDPASGGLATPACPRVVRLPFLIGSAPTQLCPLHGGLLASIPPAVPPEVSVPAAMPSPEPNAAPSATNSDMFGKVGSFFRSLFSH